MKKILVVEDDKRIAVSLAVNLKAEGYEVQVVHDGAMAVGAVMKYRPDLLLLDINMPAGSGIKVVERVMNLAEVCTTPFIFMTASKDVALQEQARALKPVAFFEKPYDITELLTAIGASIGLQTP